MKPFILALTLLTMAPLEASNRDRLSCIGFTEKFTKHGKNYRVNGVRANHFPLRRKGSGCRIAMPLYSQRSKELPHHLFAWNECRKKFDRMNNSMICGPTSAAMALIGFKANGTDYKPNSLLDRRDFNNMTWVEKVVFLNNHFNTGRGKYTREGNKCNFSGGGTNKTMLRYGLMSNSFQEDSKNGASRYVGVTMNEPYELRTLRGITVKANARGITLTPKKIQDRIDKGQVCLASYGHYDKNCAKVDGKIHHCVYNRTGGHIVALSGYQIVNGKTYLRANNPWGMVQESGAIDYYRVRPLKEYAYDNRPFKGRALVAYERKVLDSESDYYVEFKTKLITHIGCIVPTQEN